MRHYSDTDPAIGERILDRWRAMTPSERLVRVRELNQMVLRLAEARQAAQYPDATPEEKRLRLASLWLGPDVMRRWFNWDPDTRGR